MKGDLGFFYSCTTTLENLRLWAHERTPGIPRNVDDLETVEFADVLGAIAEDQHLTRCTQVCFTGTEKDLAEQHDQGTIYEVLGNQDMEDGGNAWKKLTEKLICSNRCLYMITQNPKKNAWHPGSVFLAELTLQSDGCIETCDIYRKKHSCRCYVLLELHKTKPTPPRLFDARDATHKAETSDTQCHHLDLIRSITKWESMCSGSLTQ